MKRETHIIKGISTAGQQLFLGVSSAETVILLDAAKFLVYLKSIKFVKIDKIIRG